MPKILLIIFVLFAIYLQLVLFAICIYCNYLQIKIAAETYLSLWFKYKLQFSSTFCYKYNNSIHFSYKWNLPSIDPDQWRTQEKISGGQGYGRPLGGPGLPRTPENFRKFAKKCRIFAYSAKNFKALRLIFARLDEKHNWLGKFWENIENFWWNSIGKLNFHLFLWKFVAKNRAFGNKIIFLQQFFPVRGFWTP